MPYATYRFNKIIAADTIRFIVTVAIVVYKGLKLVVYRMLTKSKKVVVSLDLNANHFLQEIKKLELVNELNNSLTYIGNLTDKMLENIEFDF